MVTSGLVIGLTCLSFWRQAWNDTVHRFSLQMLEKKACCSQRNKEEWLIRPSCQYYERPSSIITIRMTKMISMWEPSLINNSAQSPGYDAGRYCFLQNTDKSTVDIPNVSYHVYILSLSTDFHIRRWRGGGWWATSLQFNKADKWVTPLDILKATRRRVQTILCWPKLFFTGSQTIIIDDHWNQNMHFNPNHDFPSRSLNLTKNQGQ